MKTKIEKLNDGLLKTIKMCIANFKFPIMLIDKDRDHRCLLFEKSKYDPAKIVLMEEKDKYILRVIINLVHDEFLEYEEDKNVVLNNQKSPLAQIKKAFIKRDNIERRMKSAEIKSKKSNKIDKTQIPYQEELERLLYEKEI